MTCLPRTTQVSDCITPRSSVHTQRGKRGCDGRWGCLTILGITTWDHIVGLSRVEVFADGEFQSREAGVGAGRELVTESRAGVGQLLQGSERVAQHGTQVEFPRWLVEPPQGFHIVRIPSGIGNSNTPAYLGRFPALPPLEACDQFCLGQTSYVSETEKLVVHNGPFIPRSPKEVGPAVRASVGRLFSAPTSEQ
jgi:hypothetical protein